MWTRSSQLSPKLVFQPDGGPRGVGARMWSGTLHTSSVIIGSVVSGSLDHAATNVYDLTIYNHKIFHTNDFDADRKSVV